MVWTMKYKINRHLSNKFFRIELLKKVKTEVYIWKFIKVSWFNLYLFIIWTLDDDYSKKNNNFTSSWLKTKKLFLEEKNFSSINFILGLTVLIKKFECKKNLNVKNNIIA